MLLCAPVLCAQGIEVTHTAVTAPGQMVLACNGSAAGLQFEVADARYGRYIPAAVQQQADGSIILTFESHAPLQEQQAHATWRITAADGSTTTPAGENALPFRAVPLHEMPAVGKKIIACVGDSITFGMGITNPADKYPEQLQAMLGDAYQVGRFGHSAKTAGPVAPGYWYKEQPEYPQALAMKADIYICNLGINDTNHGTWNTAVVENGYDELIRNFRGPQGATVVLWNRLCPDFRSYDREPAYPGNINPAYNFRLYEKDTAEHRPAMESIIDRLAQKHGCPVIDMYTPLVNHPELFQKDGLHPAPAGARRIAETLRAFLLP